MGDDALLTRAASSLCTALSLALLLLLLPIFGPDKTDAKRHPNAARLYTFRV
jgi:hypothetical protein